MTDDLLYSTDSDSDIREALSKVGAPRFKFGASPTEDTFARLCVMTPDLADAWITAGYEAGANRSQTLARAARLRAEPRVEERVRYYQSVQRARLDIREDRIMAELAAVGFADPLEYYNPDGTLKPLENIPPHARATIREIRGEMSETVDPDGNVTRKATNQYKLHDKLKALELMMRARGMMDSQNTTRQPVVVMNMEAPKGLTSDQIDDLIQ